MFENFMTMFRAFLASFSWNSGNNAKYLAEHMETGVDAIIAVNPLANMFRWFLCQRPQETIPTQCKRVVVEVAVLLWHGKKKAFAPYIWAVSWPSDPYGLPASIRDIRIAALGEWDGLSAPPQFVIGKINREASTASDDQKFAESLVKLFILSGAGLNENAIEDRSVNIRLNHNGLTAEVRELITEFVRITKNNGAHDWERALIFGEDEITAYFDEHCAKPTREAALVSENRNLKSTLNDQANRLAQLEAMLAQLMAQNNT